MKNHCCFIEETWFIPHPPCSDSRLHGYTTASDPHEPLPSLPHWLIPLAQSPPDAEPYLAHTLPPLQLTLMLRR